MTPNNSRYWSIHVGVLRHSSQSSEHHLLFTKSRNARLVRPPLTVSALHEICWVHMPTSQPVEFGGWDAALHMIHYSIPHSTCCTVSMALKYSKLYFSSNGQLDRQWSMVSWVKPCESVYQAWLCNSPTVQEYCCKATTAESCCHRLLPWGPYKRRWACSNALHVTALHL